MSCSITISQFCPFMKHTRFRNPVFLCCGPCSTLASHDLMISHSAKDRSWCRKKTDKAQLISPLIYKGSPRVKIDLIHSGTHPPTSSEIFVNCRNWQTINSNSKREERGHTLEPLHNKTKVRHCKQLSVQYLGFTHVPVGSKGSACQSTHGISGHQSWHFLWLWYHQNQYYVGASYTLTSLPDRMRCSLGTSGPYSLCAAS